MNRDKKRGTAGGREGKKVCRREGKTDRVTKWKRGVWTRRKGHRTRPGSAIGVQPWPRPARGWGPRPERWCLMTPLGFLSLDWSREERKR